MVWTWGVGCGCVGCTVRVSDCHALHTDHVKESLGTWDLKGGRGEEGDRILFLSNGLLKGFLLSVRENIVLYLPESYLIMG